MPSLTIGRLAAAAGVHVETVRYYQRRGLLAEPSRPLGGIRRYGDNDLARLQFVRRARAMGFSLDEIAGLLKLDGAGACLHTRQLTESRLAEVRRKLKDLRRLESELVELVDTCRQRGADDCCPTLDRLQQ
jgi:MerR family mercuric resistance operon transcriptional regulator